MIIRFRDHIKMKQVTFGKECIVYLSHDNKVYGEGRSKRKHFMDNDSSSTINEPKEIPFMDAKDKIISISTAF